MKDRNSLYIEINKTAEDLEERSDREKTRITVDLGICEQCIFCAGYERELGDSYYRCESFGKSIDLRKSKIVRCRGFNKRGTMTLDRMFDMAYIIEPDKKSIKGFSQ